jgi:hypothetical protein
MRCRAWLQGPAVTLELLREFAQVRERGLCGRDQPVLDVGRDLVERQLRRHGDGSRQPALSREIVAPEAVQFIGRIDRWRQPLIL